MSFAGAKKILKTIIFFIFAALLIFSLTSITSCRSISQSSTTAAVETSNLTTGESADTGTDDIDKVKTIVESFGKVLANVSLLSPPDILENDMRNYFGPFLSEELISKWIKDPEGALGRLTSSPWPDHIEITDVKKITSDKYEVLGAVVEITSVEAEQGGYADKFGIYLVVERINGKWLITEFMKDPVSDNDTIAEEAAIMKDFDELLTSEARPYQVILFIDENISNISPENAGLMLERLESIQKNYKQFYTDLLFEDDWQIKLADIFNHDIEIKDLDEITDDQLKKTVTEIFDGGFKLIALEGSFYPYADYNFLKKYSDYLSQQFRDYLNVMANESDKIYSRDAALTISWDELASRLINCEEFLVLYPEDSVRKKEVGDLYMKYLVSYMIGQNNTPSYSYDNNKINQEVLDSYSKLISDHPDNITTDLIKKYQVILVENGNKVNDSIFKKLDDIYKLAVQSFKLDSPLLILEGIRNTYYQTSLAENGYTLLVNGEYIEKNKSDPGANTIIKLSDFISIEDFDQDGINDAAAILMSEKTDGMITYSLTLNLNRYFYFKNIADRIIGNDSEVKIMSLEIKENKIYLNVTLDQTEKLMIFGIEDDVFLEY